MSYSTCTHQGRADSRLLVIESQTASSFDHNLCFRCPNDSCEAILDIYTSRPFQWFKEHPKTRCFDPCNRTLIFWESHSTLKSHFRKCEWRPHTSSKWGCDTKEQQNDFAIVFLNNNKYWWFLLSFLGNKIQQKIRGNFLGLELFSFNVRFYHHNLERIPSKRK